VNMRLRAALAAASLTVMLWPTPAAASGTWSSSVAFTNQVADQVVLGGGYPVPAGATAPTPGSCRMGTYNANRSESWIAVKPGTEDLVGTSKIFFEKYSTFYDFHLGGHTFPGGTYEGSSMVTGYDCISTGSQNMPPSWTNNTDPNAAFDSQGRLYASNNGPTGDLGLCCHDEVDLVQQGGFYGWPAWAAGTRTSYPQGGLPATRSGPLAESGGGVVWAPSGMTFYSPAKDEQPTLIVAELSGQALRRFLIDAADPARVNGQEIVLQGQGRLRDAVAGPDGCLYVATSNRDTRGTPRAGDDHVLKLCPAGAAPGL